MHIEYLSENPQLAYNRFEQSKVDLSDWINEFAIKTLWDEKLWDAWQYMWILQKNNQWYVWLQRLIWDPNTSYHIKRKTKPINIWQKFW